jgi:hypothetical protein
VLFLISKLQKKEFLRVGVSRNINLGTHVASIEFRIARPSPNTVTGDMQHILTAAVICETAVPNLAMAKSILPYLSAG